MSEKRSETRRWPPRLDDADEMSLRVGEQPVGDHAHVGDRHDHLAAQALGEIQVLLGVVNLGVDRHARVLALSGDPSLDALAAGLGVH